MLKTFKIEIDRGTPARASSETVELTIDGNKVRVPKGTSLMRAATDAGIQVPKLCATDSLEPFGSCRLCLVEIEGRKGTPASCTTPVEPGMVVHTQTPKLQKLRKGVMELYISDHPLDCLTCSANGNCELQDMAGVTGCAMCATAWAVRYVDGVRRITIAMPRRTNRIPTSPTTRASASSATAACAPAKKRRARLR